MKNNKSNSAEVSFVIEALAVLKSSKIVAADDAWAAEQMFAGQSPQSRTWWMMAHANTVEQWASTPARRRFLGISPSVAKHPTIDKAHALLSPNAEMKHDRQ